MSDLTAAAMLGVLEGLTEFIPVSSTGHLILFGNYLDFQVSGSGVFEVFIQLGAILAVVVLYYRRFADLLDFSTSTEQRFAGLRGIALLSVACLPAFILGPLLHSVIKEQLFHPRPVALALMVGGVVMVLIERRKHPGSTDTLDKITFRQALGIGAFQCLAMWPGMSRSASTIIGGLVLGCNRAAAAEFSFIVAVPVMCAAVAYDLFKGAGTLQAGDLPLFAVGFVTAFFTALLAIKFFLALLKRWTLAPFGWYRIVLAVVVLAVLAR